MQYASDATRSYVFALSANSAFTLYCNVAYYTMVLTIIISKFEDIKE